MSARLPSAVYGIRRISLIAGRNAAILAYHGLFHSVFSYGVSAWGYSAHANKILLLQKKAVRAIAGEGQTTSCRPLFKEYRILTVPATFILQQVLAALKRHKRKAQTPYNTRQPEVVEIPFRRLKLSDISSIRFRLLNALPVELRNESARVLKSKLKNLLLRMAPYSVEEFLDSRFEIIDIQ